MRAFVTGGTGLLGNNLVRALLAGGHDVLALARSRAKARQELGDTRARVVVGDVTRVGEFREALRGVDVVFHTAAYFREYYTPGDHSALRRTNVEGTLELARAAHALGVSKMIDTSSAAVVGVKDDASAGDESASPSPLVLGNAYVRSKLEVGPLLHEFARERGFFVASVLPSWMWGPHDAAPTQSGQLVRDALLAKLPPAVPPGGSEIVDARDVAQAMIRIAESGRAGQRYLVSQGYHPLVEVVRALGAVAGVRVPSKTLPYALALGLAAAAETWSKLTGTRSVMSVESMRLMRAELRVSTVKLERELGVRCRPLEETLRDTVDWTRAQMDAPAVALHARRTST